MSDLRAVNADGELVPFPHPDASALREQIRALRDRIEKLEAALADESIVNSQLRGQISRMRGERNKAKELEPLAPRVQRLGEAWKFLCRHPRAVIDGDRFDSVLKALQRREADGMDMDHAEAEIRKAIFGASAYPYNGQKGRSRTGTPRQRYDDLELICRHERQIKAFSQLAAEWAEHVLLAMVKPLVHEYGQDVEARHDPLTNELEEWWSPCPTCEGRLRLAVAFSPDLEWVSLGCTGGCEPKAVRDRLREMAEALREQRAAA